MLNHALLLWILLAGLAVQGRAVTIDWSPVGNPGNAADTTVMSDGTTGYGSVPYNYSIGTYDVTSNQYAEFLNAKDPTGANTLGLWNTNIRAFSGIDFNTGNANGSKYTVFSSAQNRPVTFVSWFDAIRFANWLNNGQGTGDTESGAYTLLGGTPTPSNWLTITRNAGATVFLPTQNEWHKAAYYDANSSSYFQYPTSSNLAPTASSPTALANHANYFAGGPNQLTDVGAYSGTTSPYGAFDMGGNVNQWNETLMIGSFGDPQRGQRGGSFGGALLYLHSSAGGGSDPTSEGVAVGFRVAMIPEPSSFVLAALGLIGLVVWKRRR